jgi:hypothetical protein
LALEFKLTTPQIDRYRPSEPDFPMFTRIALFLATNFAVLILASIVMSLLGVDPSQMSGLLVWPRSSASVAPSSRCCSPSGWPSAPPVRW